MDLEITQKIEKRCIEKGKEMENLPKKEDMSGGKVHTNTQKLNWDVSVITDVFLNQERY